MTPINISHPQLQSLQPTSGQQSQGVVSKSVSVVSMDVMEQKQWWHLEEVGHVNIISNTAIYKNQKKKKMKIALY